MVATKKITIPDKLTQTFKFVKHGHGYGYNIIQARPYDNFKK